ncbi:hypothetical protein EJ05DRAFT_499317 [Pseudovirgaria hyperparasitica]|uniref:Uncharacterized protein n=1 Tax=Pseudovirgaria hyperparasitica TaxID=470096 RepID=A0A6A6WA28_9PEZI|nr:uncharacterized protein EJ05DRAFT_499317 [Pseudovirgaria hyperparasitica]KAF2758884.1 hypothetical protein EJ05DRAFT_499317 [Pseudovirgaria hyperparasitica]
MQPFNYIVPALFFNATVDRALDLGNLSSGSSLGLFHFETISLVSEPGFEVQLKATISNVNDYSITDVDPSITHPRFIGTVVPDDNSMPFQLEMSGILFNDEMIKSIISKPPSSDQLNACANQTQKDIERENNCFRSRREVPYGTLYRVLTATFQGGSSRYEGLMNSIFVASETVSDGDEPGKYLVGIKLSKVYASRTSITIGNEYE